MFIISKVDSKIITHQTFEREKFCEVFLFWKEWMKNVLDAFFDLLNFKSTWIKKSNGTWTFKCLLMLRIWNDIPKRPYSFSLSKSENNYLGHLR